MKHVIKKYSISAAVFVAAVFFLNASVEAAVTFGSATIPNPLRATSIAGLIADAINFLLLIGFIGAAGLLVYGGVLMLASLGSEEKVRKAKSVMTWAVIGLVVLVLAKAIEITLRNFIF